MSLFNIFRKKSRLAGEKELEKILKEKKPLSFDEYLKLGDKIREEGFPEKAKKIHKTLLATPNLKREREALLKKSLGLDYLYAGYYKNAVQYLMEANKLSKGQDIMVKENLLLALEKTGMWEEAIELKKLLLLEEKVYTDENFSEYIACAGEDLLNKGEEKEAKSLFLRALKYNSACRIALFYMGEIEKNKNKKIEYWEKAINVDPSLAFQVLEKAQEFYFEIKDFESLEAFLKKREEPVFKLGYAEFLIKKGKKIEAENILKNTEFAQEPSFIEKSLSIALQLDSKEILEKLNKVLHKFMKNRKFYCLVCHYEVPKFLFRCPKCGKVGRITTYKTV